jgi:hypothetical protein
MSELRSALKKAFFLVILLLCSATFAAADTLTLINGPIALTPASTPNHSITSVVFSNASFVHSGSNRLLELLADSSGHAGRATVDIFGTATAADDIVYNLFLSPDHDIYLRDYEFVPASSSFPNVFLQNGGADPVIVFYTDQPGSAPGTYLTVEVTNSWLDLNTMKWFIPADDGSGNPSCTGVCPATWTFVDAGTNLEKNSSQMELQLYATVPEPSSLYLMALGLGLLRVQLIRRTRESR